MSNSRLFPLALLMLLPLLSQVASADRLVYYAQKRLNQQGYKAGLADGVWGRKTKNAVLRFQRDLGLATTGRIDEQTQKKLGLKVNCSLSSIFILRLSTSKIPPKSDEAIPEVSQFICSHIFLLCFPAQWPGLKVKKLEMEN